MTTRKKKILGVILTLTLLVGAAAYYFTQTAQGGAYMLYTFAGAHAPLSLKYACGKDTNRRVDEKFELPLRMDKQTKDSLRGFWYYSYFRECLYRNGLDFSGNPLPETLFEAQFENVLYTNGQGAFQLVFPKGAVLHEDNALNVDLDSQLLVSRIGIEAHTVHIRTYVADDDIKLFNDLLSLFEHFSGAKAQVMTRETVENPQGIKMLVVSQEDGNQGFIFMTPELHIVHVYGIEVLSDVLVELQNSAQLVSLQG